MNQTIIKFLDDMLLNKIVDNCRGWKALVILDIDGTLLNPVQVWTKWINQVLRIAVTAEDIERSGNVSAYFKEKNQYDKVKHKIDQLVLSNEWNKDFPRINNALEGVSNLMQTANLQLACYLTARPKAILHATKTDLENKSFPEIPILMRSNELEMQHSLDWKIAAINYINSYFQGNVIVIDDSIELGLKIQEQNKELEKKIISILFRGPLALTALKNQNIISIPVLDFYVADWDAIPKIALKYT